MITALVITTVWNLLNAFHDGHKLNKLQKISHSGNAVLCCLTVIVAAFVGKCFWFVPGLLALRPLLFDNALNLIRHRDLTYVPSHPDSWIDQIEEKTFKKHIWERSNLFYVFIFGINYFAPYIAKWFAL